MKTFFYCLLLIVSFKQFANAQFTQTLHRTFVVENNVSQVKVNLNTPNIQYRETKGSRIMVEVSISADVPNAAMLNFLIENGRYELASQTDATNGTIILSAAKPANVIIVKGKECREEVSYIVYLPASIKFNSSDKSSSSTD